ncbi:acyl carrier protein [Nocardia sp. AB354]|uniref:acyl carrier protein n=1 Tax=Nocardia sp. AB354 TaxID=3413283 RepID=UPI003C1E2D92
MSDTPLDSAVGDRLAILVGEQLEIEPTSLDRDRSLSEYGVSSVVAAALAGDIEEEFGVTVDLLGMRDHPTINAMSQFLRDRGAIC